jgi:hypothetical protein
MGKSPFDLRSVYLARTTYLNAFESFGNQFGLLLVTRRPHTKPLKKGAAAFWLNGALLQEKRACEWLGAAFTPLVA